MNIPRASIWPNVMFDTTDPDETAEAEAWVRSLVGPFVWASSDLDAFHFVSSPDGLRLADPWPAPDPDARVCDRIIFADGASHPPRGDGYILSHWPKGYALYPVYPALDGITVAETEQENA